MDIEKILYDFKNNKISAEDAITSIEKLIPSYENLGYAMVDHSRKSRTGYDEIIYCEGKTPEQVAGIVNSMISNGAVNIIATRADESYINYITHPDNYICNYHKIARIINVRLNSECCNMSKLPPVAVITAGTSDIPVAEEAACTAEILGNEIIRIYDAGVAGLHRILNNLTIINPAKVLVVVAGMEGALASVVGGLTDKPVIAVPTSVGYGANFGGLSALLGMLNSCSAGVSVVNIDNGFGAGYLSNKITRLINTL